MKKLIYLSLIFLSACTVKEDNCIQLKDSLKYYKEEAQQLKMLNDVLQEQQTAFVEQIQSQEEEITFWGMKYDSCRHVNRSRVYK